MNLKNKLQKCVIFAFWLFWAPFWTPYGASFLASGAWVPSKRQGFLEPGGLEPPKVVSHPVWGHWRFRHIMFSRVGRLGPRRKRPSNMLAPGSGRQAIQKKAHRIDNHLGSATSQTQERKKEANKRITTIGSPHRGGLGAAHSDISWKLDNLPKPSFCYTMASFFMPFFGPQGARDPRSQHPAG